MPKIELLTQETIDKIAAGEVVERPASVVKELVENAIDAKATAITVEIKEGGCSLIRITDNGCGIEREQIPLAFMRHSTSKIKHVEDLISVSSLGFRGEALSSISAVARVELITKTHDELTGSRYLIEGSKEISLEEIGAPDGTTFLIKDIFYNTPARKKFLKSPQTEGNYISDIVERLAMSHPDISFKFINNNQTKLHTSGNGNRKDLIYHIYGRDISSEVMEICYEGNYFSLKGFIGKPIITRGNRNYESYFINGRYIKSSLLSKAIEEAYKNYIMQHQYPFTMLYFTFPDGTLDVNVHPTKMELRFDHNQEIYKELYDVVFQKLANRDLIPEVPVVDEVNTKVKVFEENIPEPFEKRRFAAFKDRESQVLHSMPEKKDSAYHTMPENKAPVLQTMPEKKTPVLQVMPEKKAGPGVITFQKNANIVREEIEFGDSSKIIPKKQETPEKQIKQETPERQIIEDVMEKEEPQVEAKPVYEEITLASISPAFLSQEAKNKHRIIGQLFETYWLIEYEDKLYIVDQHAAHEKVLYERTMKSLANKEHTSQLLSPPMILTLDAKEAESLEKYRSYIEELGYVIEAFGGKEYKISGIPGNLFHLDMKDLFLEMLDDFSNISGNEKPQLIIEKVASMSCKAAVKGNNKLSLSEIEALIDELLTLDNPYNCPHGRPTIISMTKYEIEKKFKRII